MRPEAKETWDVLWKQRKRQYVYRNVVMAAEHFLGGVKDRAILEVGCGRGATLLTLARKGASVTGVDYSDEALSICKAHATKNGTADRAEFLNADARRMPLSDCSFDFVFSVGLIEHFQNPAELLAEQYRVLKPSGYLLVQVPQKYSLYTVLKKAMIPLGKWPYGGWETQYTDCEVAELVREVGLRPEYVYGYGSFFLAAIRHSMAPNLDFGMFWRNGTELDVIRAIKAKTALDICVVARKDVSSNDRRTGG